MSATQSQQGVHAAYRTAGPVEYVVDRVEQLAALYAIAPLGDGNARWRGDAGYQPNREEKKVSRRHVFPLHPPSKRPALCCGATIMIAASGQREPAASDGSGASINAALDNNTHLMLDLLRLHAASKGVDRGSDSR